MNEKRLIMLRPTAGASPRTPAAVDGKLAVRNIRADDQDILGRLLFASYHGTIDDDGSSEEDFVEEVAGTLDGKYGKMLWDASFLVIDQSGRVAATSIVTDYANLRPLLAFSAVHPRHQRLGLASWLIERSLEALAREGFDRMYLVVTEGNHPAQTLYDKLGFKVSPLQQAKLIDFGEVPVTLINQATAIIERQLLESEPTRQPTLVHLCGIPGSGKTHYTNKFLARNPFYCLVQFDGVMESLPGYTCDRDNLGAREAFERWEMPARAVGYQLLQALLENKRNVIFDHSAAFPEHLDLIGKARAWGYKVEMHYMQCPTDIALSRLEEREKTQKRHTPRQLLFHRQNRLDELIPQYRKIVNRFVEVRSYD
ncbi:MAG: GNAT family N-acetyltransferase [Candidatus Melainabacteria bacterium]|nr:GNAT family N-acetyltransferase [Candidatus Melainabacteria bacterium]